MKRILWIPFFVGFLTFFTVFSPLSSGGPVRDSYEETIDLVYSELEPAVEKPSFDAFYYGMEGYLKMKDAGEIGNPRYLTIVDYSLPSTKKRLWVIDMDNHVIVQKTLVAHGKNSGVNRAHDFSNKPGTYMSSLGFFLTGHIYEGKHGLSLRLRGLEPGINDHARERDIVIHPADYATRAFIKQNGRLGRSFGCLALPPRVNKQIIMKVRRSALLFVYYPEPSYFRHSKILADVPLPNGP